MWDPRISTYAESEDTIVIRNDGAQVGAVWRFRFTWFARLDGERAATRHETAEDGLRAAIARFRGAAR